MTHVFFVRHGENKANLTKEFSYRLVDYPLTEKGRLQAAQTADHLKDAGINHIYSSPLKRALETAEYLQATTGSTITILESLRELNVGVLEQEKPSEANWQLHHEIIADWRNGQYERRFPEGENYLELFERISQAYRQIVLSHQGERIAVVSHGGSIDLPLLKLWSQAKDFVGLRPHHNCAISEGNLALAATGLRLELLRWADSRHLTGEASKVVEAVPRTGDLKA